MFDAFSETADRRPMMQDLDRLRVSPVKSESMHRRVIAGYGRCNVHGCQCGGFTGSWERCQTSGCNHLFAEHS